VTPLALAAPAKLNLDLTVVGRRPDGFHLLRTTLVLLELADRIVLDGRGGGLRMSGTVSPDVPAGDGNLAWRGLLAGLEGEPDASVRLSLEKRVPSAAGLGGGSSDAAAAWRLGRAVRGAPGRAAAPEIATLAAIGADVPFFAAQLACGIATGIGEHVEESAPVARHVVLAHPPFNLPTGAVFAELREADWGSEGNDLLAPALRLRPELRRILDAVAAVGGAPQLTGSGPTVFAVFDDPDRAAAAATRLRERGMRATMTRTRTAAADIEPLSGEEEA
jgi:4-diphosphocytidyl-2-C-methyl-D-erythritol kinase